MVTGGKGPVSRRAGPGRAVAAAPAVFPAPPAPLSASVMFWTLCGWALAAWGFLHLKQYHLIAEPPPLDASTGNLFRIWALLLSGFALSAWGFLRMPSRSPSVDTGKTVSRIVLFLILVLTVAMRVYHFDEIEGKYWQDFALPLADANILLFSHERFLIGPHQQEAFNAYVIAGIIAVFPDIGGYAAQRLSSLLMDLGSVWLLYLLGKEFGHRRIGLLAAAFGAVNRPMMALFLCMMRMPGATLAVAMGMLFSMRLFKKPTPAHFLQWTLSIGFGFYTYTSYQPTGPYLVLAVLLWALFRRKERILGPTGWLLGAGLLFMAGVLFSYGHRHIFPEAGMIRTTLVWLVEKGNFAAVASLLLVAVALRHAWRVLRGQRDAAILYWFLGTAMILVMAIPVFSDPFFNQRLTASSFLSNPDNPDTLWIRIRTSIVALFHSGLDRDDMALNGDSFLDVPFQIFLFPGLVLALLRPTWSRLFVLGGVGFGMVSHILADPAGSRFAGMIAPALLLGALGVDRILDAASLTARPAAWRRSLTVLAVGLVVFGTIVVFRKQYFHFMTQYSSTISIARQAVRDEPGRRVYIGVYSDHLCYHILLDKHRIHYLMPSGDSIPLGPGEKAQDVVLLFDSRWPPAPDTFERLRRDFPGARWERFPIYEWYRPSDVQMIRVFIPAADITEDASKFIHIKRVPSYRWLVRYFSGQYRFGRGVCTQEEKIQELAAPVSFRVRARESRMYDVFSTCTEGELETAVDGDCQFRIRTPMPTEFWVDDSLVFRMVPGQEPARRVGGVRLKAGKHRVRLMTFNFDSTDVPSIWVRPPGRLEWLPFSRGVVK